MKKGSSAWNLRNNKEEFFDDLAQLAKKKTDSFLQRKREEHFMNAISKMLILDGRKGYDLEASYDN